MTANEKSVGAPKRSERQGQCPVSDLVDLDQRNLVVSTTSFDIQATNARREGW
jgi:hypothetical protein